MARLGFLLILIGSAATATACKNCFPSPWDLPEQRKLVETYYDLPHAANNISAMRLWSVPTLDANRGDDFWPFLLQLHGDLSGELFTSQTTTQRILKEIFPKPEGLHFQFQVFDDSTVQVFLNSKTVQDIWKSKDNYLIWCSEQKPEVKHLIRLPLATRIDPLAISNPNGAIQAYCRNIDACKSAEQEILNAQKITGSSLAKDKFIWPKMVLPCKDCAQESRLEEPAWCGPQKTKSRIGECVEIKVRGQRPLEFTYGTNRLLIKFNAIDSGERETLQLHLANMFQLTYISTTMRKTPLLASSTRTVQGGGRHDACNMLRDHDINGRGYTIGLVDMGIDMHSSFFMDPIHPTPCSIDADKHVEFKQCNNVQTEGGVYKNAAKVTVNGTKYHYQPMSRKVTSIVVNKDATGGMGSSHGTSVAAAINGFMSKSNRFEGCPVSKTKHRGIAYSSKIALYDVGAYSKKDGWSISTPDHDYAKMFAVAHELQAHEFVVPFGSQSDGRYTPIADDIDRFMADNSDALVVVAAGNGGSVSSPAVSKNALAVGAVNQAFTGPAGFSSKGPTQAGLIKPDILAPGSNVELPVDDEDSTEAHCETGGVSGTSISAALIGGAATLVREYFDRGFYPSGKATKSDSRDVSAATIKAVLVNSARQRPLVTQDGFTCKTTDHSGHGSVHLENSLPFDDNHNYEMHMFEQIAYGATCQHGKCYSGQPGGDHKSSTGAEDVVLQFDIEVKNPDVPVSATLVWIDPPAVRGARNKIVQDISLEIEAPGGGIWKQRSVKQCNGIDHAFAPVENTQKVTVLSPRAKSVYTVRVRKKFVFGSQKFSVVATGGSIKKKDSKMLVCCPEGSVSTFAGCFSVDYAILTVICVIIGVTAIVALVLLSINAKKNSEEKDAETGGGNEC